MKKQQMRKKAKNKTKKDYSIEIEQLNEIKLEYEQSSNISIEVENKKFKEVKLYI